MASAGTDAGRYGTGDGLIRARYSPLVTGLFERHVRSMVRRRFHCVRMVEETVPVLRDAEGDERPLVVVMNHSSWWDPLVPLMLRKEFFQGRTPLAVMDREQLEKFGFFRRLGIFGIDPDDPASLDGMGRYVIEHLSKAERAAFLVTPQGRFADPREPMRLRPGIAAILARAEREGLRVRVVSLAIEYTFWLEQKPEIFLRAAECSGDLDATTAWHRRLTQAMEANGRALAEAVVRRDPRAFRTLLGGSAGVHPVYDLLLRLRGKRISLEDSSRVGNRDGHASGGADRTKTPTSEGVS